MKKHYVAALSGALMALHAGVAFARSDDVTSRGTLDAISSTHVTVGDLTCPTDGGTEYEDLQGRSISRAQFDVGDIVKLVCRGGVAHSLELENDISGGGGGGSGGSSSGGGGKEVKLKSRLRLVEGVASGSVAPAGKIEYRNKLNGAGRDDRFTVTVKIPVPSVVPVADTLTAAKVLDMSATLARDGTPYAQCTLGFDHRVAMKGLPAAEHKIDLRYEQKGSKLRLKSSKGKCDMDLTTDGLQAGFPSIKKGDTVVIEDSLAGEFLSGSF